MQKLAYILVNASCAYFAPAQLLWLPLLLLFFLHMHSAKETNIFKKKMKGNATVKQPRTKMYEWGTNTKQNCSRFPYTQNYIQHSIFEYCCEYLFNNCFKYFYCLFAAPAAPQLRTKLWTLKKNFLHALCLYLCMRVSFAFACVACVWAAMSVPQGCQMLCVGSTQYTVYHYSEHVDIIKENLFSTAQLLFFDDESWISYEKLAVIFVFTI